jgi:hypothetical protein
MKMTIQMMDEESHSSFLPSFGLFFFIFIIVIFHNSFFPSLCLKAKKGKKKKERKENVHFLNILVDKQMNVT